MSRQVQWRRFNFFDKETITEDIAAELGAQVSCMHTAGGRLYLGECCSGYVTCVYVAQVLALMVNWCLLCCAL